MNQMNERNWDLSQTDLTKIFYYNLISFLIHLDISRNISGPLGILMGSLEDIRSSLEDLLGHPLIFWSDAKGSKGLNTLSGLQMNTF